MTVRQLARLALAAAPLLVPACASTPASRADPGEAPETFTDARGHSRIPDHRQPTQQELAAAFDAPESAATPDATAPVQALADPAAQPDPLAPLRAAFDHDLAKARATLRADPSGAAALGEALERKAEPLEPPYLQKALRLRTDAALAQQDGAAAWALGLKWLGACGPGGVDRCRGEVERVLARIAPGTDQPKRARAQLAQLREADACTRKVEAQARQGRAALDRCREGAARLYRAHDDRLMLARLQLAEGESALRAGAGDAVRLLERAESTCSASRCVDVRRHALAALVTAHLGRGDAEQAARAALREMALYAGTLPPAQRPWAWTRLVSRTCAAYDARAGEGACRNLEREVVGRWTFRDFSADFAGQGLSAAAVKAVNAHYGITLQRCLADQARRLQMPAQERYTVRWVVLNDGRVGEVHLDRRQLDDGPLAQCLRQQLALWRYPRYGGEYQHVEQSFLVTASTRR